ncbi:hypothetical protein TNIN_194401 [Trichonephila inaurata madagascariensis]|uniref:Uncharacterized protein n=1 Tax=Trichonephila inaurata madagascariensis TaxID=2747483 RepID=A0A8X6YGB3_9ARAC|nr:hypothetical protein TNIN_194401 [Trichonephila inaurata madagascariensis]
MLFAVGTISFFDFCVFSQDVLFFSPLLLQPTFYPLKISSYREISGRELLTFSSANTVPKGVSRKERNLLPITDGKRSVMVASNDFSWDFSDGGGRLGDEARRWKLMSYFKTDGVDKYILNKIEASVNK